MYKTLFLAFLCLFFVGCTWLFGDGTPENPGAFSEGLKVGGPILGSLPFGSAIMAALTAVGAIGTGIQTYRKRRDEFDLTKVFNELKAVAPAFTSDKDVNTWLKKKAKTIKILAATKKIYDKAVKKEEKKNG